MTATYRGGALPVPAYCSSRPRAVWRMVGSSWGENDRFFFCQNPLGLQVQSGGSLLWRWRGVSETVDLVQRKSLLLEAQVILETQRMKPLPCRGTGRLSEGVSEHAQQRV